MATKREELDAANRGEGCLGKAADDEPVFIIRAQDMLSADQVRYWAHRAEALGCNPAKVLEARELANKMDAWPNTKIPD
jgi:hypothetical protein